MEELNKAGRFGKLHVGVYMVSAIVLGVLVGILTVLGQKVLPGNWNSLANSGTVWLIPAFFIGAYGSTIARACTAGIMALSGMVAGYYGYSMFVQDVSHSLFYITIWAVAAIIGGIIFGCAGYLWGRDKSRKHKYGSALLGGVFITEGLHLFVHLDDYKHMIAVGVFQIIVGITLILALERSRDARVASLLSALPVLVLGMIGYQLLYVITS